MKKHNYSAGPCILPQEVFEKATQAIMNFNGLDLSILEISHRSDDFVAVMDGSSLLFFRTNVLCRSFFYDGKDKGAKAIC